MLNQAERQTKDRSQPVHESAGVSPLALNSADSLTAMVKRIHMWSPPRACSTALMYSFNNRPDTTVVS